MKAMEEESVVSFLESEMCFGKELKRNQVVQASHYTHEKNETSWESSVVEQVFISMYKALG